MRVMLMAKNFNGQTFTEHLDDAVVFVGKNGVGKSTRLKAFLLAALGYIPGGPKQARDIMSYSTDKDMLVGFAFPFLRVERRYSGSTASARMRLDVAPDMEDGASDKDKQARIIEEIGGVPFSLDLGQFIGMNENQQRSFILSLCAPEDEGDPVEIVYSKMTEKGQDPKREIMKSMVEALPPAEERGSLAEVLGHLIGMLRSKQSELQRAIKNAEGTARDMSKARRELNTSAAAISETKEELARIQKDLEALASEKGKLASSGGANEMIASQLEALRRRIREREGSLHAGARTMDEAQGRLQALAKRREALHAKVAELEKEIEQKRSLADVAREAGQEADKQAEKNDFRLRQAQKRADLLEEGKCPVGLKCKHPKKAFNETLQLALKAIGYFSKLKAKAEERQRAVADELGKLASQEAEARLALKRAENELAALREEVSGAERDIQTLEEIRELKDQLTNLSQEAEKGVVTAGAEEIEAREAGLRARRQELQKTLEEQELQKANEIAFARALEDKQRFAEELEYVKAAIDILGPKGLQAEAAKTAAGPFLNAMNLTLREFKLKAFIELERGGKPAFRWGLEHPEHGRRVFDVLPESYKAIMGAAVAMAFLVLRAAKKAILVIDNLEHLDFPNRMTFLQMISKKLREGSLDFFIGASTDTDVRPVRNIKIVNLDSSRAKAA